VLVGLLVTFNSVFASSLPTGAIDYIADYFHVTDQIQLVLPISTYQIGFLSGALLFGPLSETYGRRLFVIVPSALFMIFTLADALSPTYPAFVVFRLLCGINASSAIAITGALYADIFNQPVSRGRVNSIFLFVSMTRSYEHQVT